MRVGRQYLWKVDAMGQKMLVESTKAERVIEEVGNEQADFMKEMEIVYNPKDQKKILDFNLWRDRISV